MEKSKNNKITYYPNNSYLIIVGIILTIIYLLVFYGVTMDNKLEGFKLYLNIILFFLAIFSMLLFLFYKKNAYILLADTKLIFSQPLHSKKEFNYKDIIKCDIQYEGDGYPVIVLNLTNSTDFKFKGAFSQSDFNEIKSIINQKIK